MKVVQGTYEGAGEFKGDDGARASAKDELRQQGHVSRPTTGSRGTTKARIARQGRTKAYVGGMTKVSGVAVRLAQTERLLDRVLKLKDRWQIRALNAEAYSEDMPKPIISEDLSNALADCVPKSAMPYVLSHLKGRMYSRAMAKLRDAHHEEFEELYRAEVQGYVDEHARDGDDAARA